MNRRTASVDPRRLAWTASGASGKMQLDPLQQLTQFSVSPSLRAAIPRRASRLARSGALLSERIRWASAKQASASSKCPRGHVEQALHDQESKGLKLAGLGPTVDPGELPRHVRQPALEPERPISPQLVEGPRVPGRRGKRPGDIVAAVVHPVLGEERNAGRGRLRRPRSSRHFRGWGTAETLRGRADRPGSVIQNTAAGRDPDHKPDDGRESEHGREESPGAAALALPSRHGDPPMTDRRKSRRAMPPPAWDR